MNEQQSPGDGEHSTGAGQTPDFELPRHDAIREGSWAEYEAKGFVPTPFDFDYAQGVYGPEHVYSGDEFSWAEGRPLRHKPGTGVYVSPEGIRLASERKHEQQERLRERRERGEPDPGEQP
jgi:hypothetical protein